MGFVIGAIITAARLLGAFMVLAGATFPPQSCVFFSYRAGGVPWFLIFPTAIFGSVFLLHFFLAIPLW
jgi:hypothetical protein